MAGTGGFVKLGAGTLNATGPFSNTGAITVNAGTLSLTGAFTGTGSLTLNGGTLAASGAALNGNGAATRDRRVGDLCRRGGHRPAAAE